MLPVLIHFQFLTPFSQAVAYLLALGVVAYSVYSSWLPAAPGAPESAQDVWFRRGSYAVGSVAASLVALHYMLPASAFLGGKGEGLPLHTYGLLLATGFLLAVRVSALLAEREWRQDGVKRRNQVLDLAFWVLLSAIAGSKLLFMLVNWRDQGPQFAAALTSPSRFIDLLSGGLVFQGGLIGAMLASYLYAKKHDMDFFRLADVAAPTVSLGAAIGRLGCFSAGCCWGDVAPQGSRFAVFFPGPERALDVFGRYVNTASLAFQSQLSDHRWVLESTGQLFHQAVPHAVQVSDWVMRHHHTLAVYPTQILDSLGNLTLFVVMMAARRLRRFHGQILGMWLMAYAVLRTSVELFRGDVERGTLHGLLDSVGGASLADKVPLEAWYNLSTGQFISLCMFALGATLLVRRSRDLRASAAPHPSSPVSA
jgi:phosphatidylglycerol:prolipoprotein diacylglycerol transferase